MGIFAYLGMADNDQATIDWDITPANSFTIFESWGSKERMVRNKSERYYYFFIDTWQTPARVYLMERGIKHAKILASIAAPKKMVDHCINSQGRKAGLDKCYAIDQGLKAWLQANIMARESDNSLIQPIIHTADHEEMETGLPDLNAPQPELSPIILPDTGRKIGEEDLAANARRHNFFDSRYNPAGKFDNYLIDNGDHLTVTDLVTGLMWQRQGCDIASIRHIREYITTTNSSNLAGYNDWRLPTMEEAWSLMEPGRNNKGLYLHPCFSKNQPFIFVSDRRDPGGYWFADFKQGSVFWASGTIPGGFGRLCRRIK